MVKWEQTFKIVSSRPKSSRVIISSMQIPFYVFVHGKCLDGPLGSKKGFKLWGRGPKGKKTFNIILSRTSEQISIKLGRYHS